MKSIHMRVKVGVKILLRSSTWPSQWYMCHIKSYQLSTLTSSVLAADNNHRVSNILLNTTLLVGGGAIIMISESDPFILPY